MNRIAYKHILLFLLILSTGYMQAQDETNIMDNNINWQNRSKVFYKVWPLENDEGYHITKTQHIFIIDNQVYIMELPHGESRVYKIKELEYHGDSIITAMVDFDYMASEQYPDILAGHRTVGWKEMHNPGKSIKQVVFTKDKSTLLWTLDIEDFAPDSPLWIDNYDILPSGYYYQNQATTPHNPDNENFQPAERTVFSGQYKLDEKPIEITPKTKGSKKTVRPYEGTWLEITKTAIGDVVYDYPPSDEGVGYEHLTIKVKNNVLTVIDHAMEDSEESSEAETALFYPNSGVYRFHPWAGLCYEFKWIDKEKHICQWTIYRINWNTHTAHITAQKSYINKAHNNLPVITYDWE